MMLIMSNSITTNHVIIYRIMSVYDSGCSTLGTQIIFLVQRFIYYDTDRSFPWYSYVPVLISTILMVVSSDNTKTDQVKVCMFQVVSFSKWLPCLLVS